MSLKNYSTTVDGAKTVAEIQNILSSHGAKKVLFEYTNEGYVESVSFIAATPHGDMPIRLPCDWKPVQTILKSDPKVQPRYETKEQAIRVAWRILKDWVDSQMAILETQMVTIDQVFLPYMETDNGQTFYDRMIDSKFQLPDASTEASEDV